MKFLESSFCRDLESSLEVSFDLSAALLERVDDALFDDSMTWLREEGVIRFQEIVGDDENPSVSHFLDTRLSSYGFALLQQKSPISGTNPNERLGETIQNVGSQKNLSSMGDLLGGILGGFTKSIMN